MTVYWRHHFKYNLIRFNINQNLIPADMFTDLKMPDRYLTVGNRLRKFRCFYFYHFYFPMLQFMAQVIWLLPRPGYPDRSWRALAV
jgi:hypothetical protein